MAKSQSESEFEDDPIGWMIGVPDTSLAYLKEVADRGWSKTGWVLVALVVLYFVFGP